MGRLEGFGAKARDQRELRWPERKPHCGPEQKHCAKIFGRSKHRFRGGRKHPPPLAATPPPFRPHHRGNVGRKRKGGGEYKKQQPIERGAFFEPRQGGGGRPRDTANSLKEGLPSTVVNTGDRAA
ncbi:hypothetical protein NDU88_002786 [Pleurodeles waltl]|uniref:Uncharacterized protein n=1 Tax=Pleurodeles waltl TaxID=8319 RepID=A0AAV7VBJ6_PLEWA|nr:hypothetical protein NDU88_002786 [Pleurodeles waltl]